MIHFIFGASSSKKSEYAEKIAAEAAAQADERSPAREIRLLYAATMINDCDEAAARIEKHRKQRAHKDFELYEATNLEDLKNIPHAHTILFDCVSNFTANVMFAPREKSQETVPAMKKKETVPAAGESEISARISDALISLSEKCENLIFVADMLFSDGCPYDSAVSEYIHVLGEVGRRIALAADSVTEVVFGIPVSYDIKRS